MAISKAELDRLCDRPYHDLNQVDRAAVLERCSKTCGDTLFPLLTQHLAKHPSDTARRAMIQVMGHEPDWPKSHLVRRTARTASKPAKTAETAKTEEPEGIVDQPDPTPSPAVDPEPVADSAPDPDDSGERLFTPSDPFERIMLILDDLHREARALDERAWDEADTDWIDLANAVDTAAIVLRRELARRMGEAL